MAMALRVAGIRGLLEKIRALRGIEHAKFAAQVANACETHGLAVTGRDAGLDQLLSLGGIGRRTTSRIQKERSEQCFCLCIAGICRLSQKRFRRARGITAHRESSSAQQGDVGIVAVGFAEGLDGVIYPPERNGRPRGRTVVADRPRSTSGTPWDRCPR